MTRRLFALEHYDHTGGAALPDSRALAAATGARLVGVVHLPADEVVLALVEGPDARTVAGAAASVGWRVDRLTSATWYAPPPEQGRGREDGGRHQDTDRVSRSPDERT